MGCPADYITLAEKNILKAKYYLNK